MKNKWNAILCYETIISLALAIAILELTWKSYWMSGMLFSLMIAFSLAERYSRKTRKERKNMFFGELYGRRSKILIHSGNLTKDITDAYSQQLRDEMENCISLAEKRERGERKSDSNAHKTNG